MPTVPVGLRPVYLLTEVPKCQCREGNHRFEVAPLFAPSYRRLTHRMVEFVPTRAQVMCLSDVAGLTGGGWDRGKDLVKARGERD